MNPPGANGFHGVSMSSPTRPWITPYFIEIGV